MSFCIKIYTFIKVYPILTITIKIIIFKIVYREITMLID